MKPFSTLATTLVLAAGLVHAVPAQAAIWMFVSRMDVSETNSVAALVLDLGGEANSAVGVTYSTIHMESSAIPHSDYVPETGQVMFATGVTCLNDNTVRLEVYPINRATSPSGLRFALERPEDLMSWTKIPWEYESYPATSGRAVLVDRQAVSSALGFYRITVAP